MMMTLTQIAAACTAVGVIGGGALGLDKLHVASEDFDKYIEQRIMSDERDYVQELKKDIRDITGALIDDPDEEYLIEALAEMLDQLCELRPEDRLCEVDE